MSDFNEQTEKLEKQLDVLGREFRKTSSAILPEGEKRKMHNALLFAMREFPATEKASARKSQRSNVIVTIKHIIAGATIVGLLGGTVSFAAGGALPGDLLYPVKTSINEEVRSALAVSAESKAEVHAKLAERRLEEAEKLAASGRLDATTSAQIAEGFLAHAERAETHSEKAEAKAEAAQTGGGAEATVNINSNFESALEAHEKVLAKIEAKVTLENLETKEHLELVLGDVRAKISAVSKRREAGEERVSLQANAGVKTSAETAMKSAQDKIDEVKRLLGDGQGELSTTTATTTVTATSTRVRASIEARVARAEKIFAEGKVRFDAGAYGEAFALFKKSEREVQSSKLLMRAANEFNIEINGVHATGSLDIDREVDLLNGKIQIKKGAIEVNVGDQEEDEEDGYTDNASTSSVKINVGGEGSSTRVYSSTSAGATGSGSASVQVNQKIQVNSNSKIQVGL